MLALIAGQGALPAILYRHLASTGAPPLVAELAGYAADIDGVQPMRFRVELLATFLQELQAGGVTEVCFAGSIARPRLDPSAVDAATMPLVPRIVSAIQAGDDGALRAVIAIFEEAGIAVRGAHEVMPELLPQSGVLTQRLPSERDRLDAKRGAEILAAMGAADVGQSCAVAAGQSLAVEAIGGTDWMLATLAGSNRPKGSAGGIFFKGAKPTQDRRVDLPVIGPETIERVKSAGLSGIVIEFGNVMVLELAQVLALAEANDLFIWVRERE